MLEQPKAAPYYSGENRGDTTMADQQERLVSSDFIAGLIVGEGTFTLAVYRHGAKTRIKPQFSMQMNDGETMQVVARSLESMGLPSHVYHRENRGCWTMQASGFLRVTRYLDTFLPLLTGTKREAALIVNEFITSRSLVSKFDSYTVDELNMVTRIRSVNGVPGRKRTDISDLIGETRNRQWKQRESSETARLAS